MKEQRCLPKRVVTDKLRSYGAAQRQVMPAIEHRSHKGRSNRAENSHLPLRKKSRSCKEVSRFWPSGSAWCDRAQADPIPSYQALNSKTLHSGAAAIRIPCPASASFRSPDPNREAGHLASCVVGQPNRQVLPALPKGSDCHGGEGPPHTPPSSSP